MGGTRSVYDGAGWFDCVFLVAGRGEQVMLNNFFVSFVLAFAVFCAVFLGLDYSIMKLQGLTLLFQH